MTDEHVSGTVGDVLNELDDCLEREKTALLSGDLNEISDLMDKKSGLIARLNAFGASDDNALDALKAKAERNQILLGGALEGVRAVADRLADMQKLRRSFDTYDSNGMRQTIKGQIPRNVEKRA